MEKMHKTKQASKHLARTKYKERKIDTYIKWSINQRGFLKWKDLPNAKFNETVVYKLDFHLYKDNNVKQPLDNVSCFA